MFRGVLSTRRLFFQSFVSRKSTVSSLQGTLDRQRSENIGNSSKSDSQGSVETVFAASRRGSFFQEAPRLRNQFNGDLLLQSYLKRILPSEVRNRKFIFSLLNCIAEIMAYSYITKLSLYPCQDKALLKTKRTTAKYV